MDALLTWEGTLHTFGGGATGWSFFYTDNFDDPGKILALSTATALAAPFEDELVHGGTPLISTALQVVDGVLRAWSGVELATSHWLVLSPGEAGWTQPSDVTFTLSLPKTAKNDTKYIACDLTNGQAYSTHPHSAGQTNSLSIHAALKRTTVVHVLAATSCEGTKKLPSDAWLPVDDYN
jgi:hypothetical protein